MKPTQIKILPDSSADVELLTNLEVYAKARGLKPVQAARSLLHEGLARAAGMKELRKLTGQAKPEGGSDE